MGTLVLRAEQTYMTVSLPCQFNPVPLLRAFQLISHSYIPVHHLFLHQDISYLISKFK